MINFIKQVSLFFLKKTNQIKWARKLGVQIGENCRFYNVTFSTEPYLIKIGNHVSATKVHFETHDGGIWIFRETHPDWDIIKPITIGDNVYIGTGSIILPGVTIGNNVIIGAYSVVTKNLESNCVYAGIPAKRIKSIKEYYLKAKENKINSKRLTKFEKKKLLKDFYNISN